MTNDANGTSTFKPTELFSAAYECLLIADPVAKATAARILYGVAADLPRESATTPVVRLEQPGMPDRPALVDPQQMKKRGVGSVAGRIALLHALAHIEFNAINLALDAVYRFRDMPERYAIDWLQVASDEGRHFLLLAERLKELDSYYGSHDAHAGLWNMALQTDHDVLVRMALVPRVLEARGLDVAPGMIKRLQSAGDTASAEILDVIYHDEIEHVRIGNHWFGFVCDQRGLKPLDVFSSLLKQHTKGVLRGPYNAIARIQAGFTDDELLALEQIEKEFRG
ncbi:MAG: ferritin-like domain-containing protein [Gammaproteobacteria bacterium]|nr:ferritin-like domain-containing protein [Gammaproteobacteria bacterium]